MNEDGNRALPYTAGCTDCRHSFAHLMAAVEQCLPCLCLGVTHGRGVACCAEAASFEGQLAGAASLAGRTAGGCRPAGAGGRAAAHLC